MLTRISRGLAGIVTVLTVVVLSGCVLVKKPADWALGYTSLDPGEHWVLKCPHCLSPNEYPATTCRDCGKDFKVEAFTCPNCNNGKNPCSQCDGTGRGKCHNCNGIGYSARWCPPKYNKVTVACPGCDGTGKRSSYFIVDNRNDPCFHCGGRGKVSTKVNVPGSDREKIGCQHCGGAGQSNCIYCDGGKYIRCNECKGKGHFEAVG